MSQMKHLDYMVCLFHLFKTFLLSLKTSHNYLTASSFKSNFSFLLDKGNHNEPSFLSSNSAKHKEGKDAITKVAILFLPIHDLPIFIGLGFFFFTTLDNGFFFCNQGIHRQQQ